MKLELARLIDAQLLTSEFELTTEAVVLYNEIDNFLQPAQSKTTTGVVHPDWDTSIETYRKIFPSGHGSGKAFRSPVRELVPRFQWFFKCYPYSWDIVLEATRRYVTTKLRDDGGAQYIKTSAYFIRKQDTSKAEISDLAHWCELVQQEHDDPESVKPEMDYHGLYKVV